MPYKRRRLARPPRFFRRRHFFYIFLILAILGGAAYCSYYCSSWVYGKITGRQSRKLTQMAAEYLQHGKATEAAMSLETALRLQPSNAEALRLLARLKGSTGEGPKSLENWRKLAEGGSLTLEDLSLYAVAAAGENEWELAERIADTAATGGNPALRHLLRAELLTSKKDLPGAEAELRLAVDADKTGKARIALARFLMTHRFNAETAPEMLELLREVSKLQDERGVDAIATAMRIGVVPPAELPIWINALREHPKVNARTLFLADTVEWQSNPASKPAVLERMLQRMHGAPVDDRAAGVQFLVHIGEPAQAAALLSRDEALKNREVFSLWLNAQSLIKNWSAILDALAQPNLPLPAYLTKLYSGRALVMSGNESAGRAAYAEALQQSLENQADLLQALAYLNLAGEDQFFEQGFKHVLSDPATAKESFIKILPSVAMRRDATHTRRVYEIAAATSPDLAKDLTLQNDLAYLNLLLGLPEDTNKVAFQSDANPRDFAFRVTYALALLKGGKNKEALTLLENCEPDVLVPALPPHHKAIVAIALAANGRKKEALGAISTVPPQELSAQEFELLRSYLPQPESSPPPTPAMKKTEAQKKK
jgi:thioredoxin-like negative regulator of GroEL